MWQVLDSQTDPITGCVWPIEDCPCEGTTLSPNLATSVDQMAVEVLYAASGRQFGRCGRTIRPCLPDCGTQVPSITTDAYLWYLTTQPPLWWSWAYVRCGLCAKRRCSCGNPSTVILPDRRIRSVSNVTIDGVVLSPANYRLAGRRLIRTDGEAWPSCQDDTVDIGAVGSWSVTYAHGKLVPFGGRLAAGVYACELAKALSGDACELPQRVQTITRQGVTIGVTDPMEFLEHGRTGLYTVDAWLASVNPAGLHRRPGLVRADTL